MIDRVVSQLQKLGSRVEWILRTLQDLRNRLAWCEQRIRELNFPTTQLGLSNLSIQAWDTAVVAKATSSISARSGTTYGTGTAKLQTDGGTSLSDYSPTTTFTAKNLLNKTIANNSLIVCVLVSGSWWVIAVDDCSHVS